MLSALHNYLKTENHHFEDDIGRIQIACGPRGAGITFFYENGGKYFIALGPGDSLDLNNLIPRKE